MLLITEAPIDIEYIIEEDNKGVKQRYISGTFMVAETKNRNGRIYPRNILERECLRYLNESINRFTSTGELGHPESPNINLDRVSHLVTELRPMGNNFVGKAKILDTPNGKIVKSLLDGGVTLGVSTRGVGSLKPHNGAQLVQEDFKLAAIDVVSDPSGPGCFVQGIMENADWYYDNLTEEWHHRLIEETRKTFKQASKREIEETALKIFQNFIKKL